MKTLNIIVSFCLFGLLNYDRIFGKNLERDAYGVKRNPWLRTLWGEGGGVVPDLFPKIYVSFNET